MNAKLYVLKSEFASLKDIQDIEEEIMNFSDKQKNMMLESFEEEDIMKRAQSFIMHVEKQGDLLICKHDFLDRTSTIMIHHNYIQLFDIEHNIFISFLQRLYRNTFLIKEL